MAGGPGNRWAGARRAAWWPAVPLVVVQLASGMCYLPQTSFFPIFLQEQLGLAPVTIAGVVAGAQVAGMAAALLGGALTGALGSKWVLVCGLAGAAVASLVYQVRAPWLAAGLWFLGGAGMALHTLGGSSYLTRLGARGALGVLSATYALGLTLGGAAGNPLAGLILQRIGYRAFGLAVTSLITLTGVSAALFMAHLGDRSPEGASLRALWSGALVIVRRPAVRLLLGMRCLPTILYGMLLVFVPLLINDLTGSKTLVAAYATTNLIVASGAQLLAGRIADRIGTRAPTLGGYALLTLSALGLAATAAHAWGLFVFGVLSIATAWALAALMYLWVADGLPKSEHAWAFGLLHATWSLSMVVGSLLGGWLLRGGAGLPFLAGGLINAAALVLTLAYYGRVGAQKAGAGGGPAG